MSYWLIFLTGLTTGGLTCLAVQGGLLAATLANTIPNEPRAHHFLPTLMFVVSKLAAYTLLGALLGYFGSLFQLSTPVRIGFQVVAAVMMLGLAGNLLHLHPVFRYFVITPPKWIGRLLRRQSHQHNFFAPAMMGAFTVLIPCSVTQAMEILAISSGHPISGALVMGSFILGTSPIFLALGWLTTRFSATLKLKFFKVAAVLVIFIALASLNGALVLAGSKYSLNNWVWAFHQVFLPNANPTITQNVTITASSRGYTPNQFSVKAGQPVNLTITSSGNLSCSSIFTIPALGITRNLPVTGAAEVNFTPAKPGPIAFACGMGMYTGTINVVP